MLKVKFMWPMFTLLIGVCHLLSACGNIKSMGCKVAGGVGATDRVAKALPDEVTASETLPALNDTLTVKTAALANANHETTVKFMQNCEDKKIVYVVVDAEVKGKVPFKIFIQKAKFEAFKSGAQAQGEQLSHKITNAFQYGQNSDKSQRWVVFHDLKLKPFQHRFIETNMLKSLSSAGQSMAAGAQNTGVTAVVPSGDQAAKLVKEGGKYADASVGHYLRTFNK
jgi:hypothetical protein